MISTLTGLTADQVLTASSYQARRLIIVFQHELQIGIESSKSATPPECSAPVLLTARALVPSYYVDPRGPHPLGFPSFT